MSKSIYLIGVGNYTEVIIELARDCGYTIEGLYHYNSDRLGDIVDGIEIIGTTQDIFEKDITNQNFGITIGNNNKRATLANKIREAGGTTPSLIHPKATISPSARIGKGCFIHHGAFVWTGSTIDNDCILSPNAFVAHHSKVNSGCSITPYSVVGSYCELEEQVVMGINSNTISNITIGKNTVIGAKANVIRNCEPNVTMVGNPAKKLNK